MQDCFGETAAHKAARIGNITAIIVLLQYNASLVYITDIEYL
jgi:hypothetical protein